jgi:hypothetical protein
MRQGTSGFLLMCSKFYPDMFRQVVAIFRGVIGALLATQAMSVLWAYTGYGPFSVASCR